MNKKSNGTTLIEIIVSIILISFVMIFLFNILVDLKSENDLTSKKSTDALNRASYTRIIQNDFINLGLKGITNCSNGIFCLTFTFDNNTSKRFIVESNSVIYADEKWEISSGNYIRNNIKFVYKVATTNSSELATPDVKNYHLLKIVIPVTMNLSSNRKYDVEITNVSDKALSLSCSSLTNYIGAANVECTNA